MEDNCPKSAMSRSPMRLPAIAAGFVAVIALLNLVGWSFGIVALKSVGPGLVAMNPVTALVFLFSAAAVSLLSTRNRFVWQILAARLCAIVVLLVGLMRLASYLGLLEFRLDQLLFFTALGDNQIAPNTALQFLLLGIALLALDGPGSLLKSVSQILVVIVIAGATMSLVGYGFGAQEMYRIGSYIPMALNTACSFAVLALGLLAARPARGLCAVLLSTEAGGLMARRLLPAAIVIPIVIGILRVAGQNSGLYETQFGAALMVVATVVMLVGAILVTAVALNRTDLERRRAAEELRRLNVELEKRVEERTAELREVNEELRENETRKRAIVDSALDCIITIDHLGRIIEFNPAAEKVFGYSREIALGQSVAELIIPVAFREGHARGIAHFLNTGEGPILDRRIEVAALRSDGTEFPAELAVTAVRLQECPVFTAFLRDITERKRAEEEGRRLTAELKNHVHQLAENSRDLAQKNQENEMFVYSVSHDLRSPLVNLQGFSKELEIVCQELASVLKQEGIPATARERGLALIDQDVSESVRFIQTAVLRLSTIIDALLRLSRAGRVELDWQPVELQPLVTRVEESLRGTIDKCGATVLVRPLPTVWGDPGALEQVFGNLIGNALKYLEPQRLGQIEIGCVQAEDSLEVTCTEGVRTFYVRDNGLGIAPAHQNKVFQAFQRAHPHVASGEGMGLAIVKRVVERHRGKVWLESVAGHGTTFFVTLPATPPATGNDTIPLRRELERWPASR